jgi:hypothetical protein
VSLHPSPQSSATRASKARAHAALSGNVVVTVFPRGTVAVAFIFISDKLRPAR